MFDAYHKWLGIPKDQRPPTHYQLLGIAAGEADPDVIDEAALRQTAHVRNYQVGPHAADATRILNEISHAKVTLLNPAKRQAYDAQLAKRSAAITTKAPAPQPVTVPADPAFAFDEEEVRPPPPPPRREVDIARPPGSNTGLIIGLSVGGVAILLLIVALVVILSSGTDVVKPVVKKEQKEVKPILKVPEEQIEKEPPVIIQKPPVIIKQPPVGKQPPVFPGGGVRVAGSRSFKSRESQIQYLSLSPDGSKVALGGLNPHVHDVATGNHLVMFPPIKIGGVVKTPVAFAPDNRRLLYSYGSDPGASLGDVTTGQRLFNLPQEEVQYASAVAVSPDGKHALVGHNHRVVYWDLENQKEIKSWLLSNFIVHAIVFTPDGKKAVTANNDGPLAYWDLEKLEMRAHRHPNINGVHSISMAPDGNTIAVGSSKSLTLVEFPQFTVKVINLPDDPTNHTAVAFFGKGKRLLTAGKDGLVHMIDLDQLRIVSWQGHTTEVTRIAVDANERIAVSGDRTGTVFVWPLPQGPIAAAPGAPEAAGVVPKGMRQFVTRGMPGTYAVAFLPDGKSFITAGLTVERWDTSGVRIRQFAKQRSTSDRVYLSVSGDGKRVAWGEGKDPPGVFEVDTGRDLGQIAGRTQVHGLALSPDGSRALAGFGDGTAVVWDVDGQKIVQELPRQLPPPHAIGFVPHGKHAIFGHISGKVQLLDTTTWKPAAEAMTNPFPRGPAFTTDGKVAALSAGNRIWLLDTGNLQSVGQFQARDVRQLAFCAKGQILLTMSPSEQAIAVWDVAKQAMLTRWELPERCHAFAVDPQESSLVVIAANGNACTWPLPARPEDVAAGAPAAPVQAPAPATPVAPVARPSAAPNGLKQIVTGDLLGIQAVKILPDGKSFVAGGPTIGRWSVNGARLRQFHANRASARFLSHSADGKRLAWGNLVDAQVVVEVDTGREIGKFAGKRGQLAAMSLSPDGSRVFSAFEDGSAVLWNAATGGIVQELSKQRPSIHGVEFVPDGKHAILAHVSGKVQLMDTTTGKAAATEVIGGFQGGPTLSADGKIAALAGTSGVSLLDTANLQTVGELPIKTVRQMAFCAKGQLLLALHSSQPSIVVWDVAKQQSLTRWELPEVCRAMAVDAQESFVLVVSQRGNAYTWPLPATPGEFSAPPPTAKVAPADAKVHDVPAEGLLIRDTITPQDSTVLFAPGLMRPSRTFSVNLQAGQRYRFDLEGPNSLDPLLVIYTPAGARMAFDDDGGGNFNSRIQLLPPTDGAYRVSAGSLTNKGGEFVLKVSKLTQ